MKLILSLILTQLLVYPLQAQTYDDIKTLSTAIGNKYGITLYFDTFPETSLDVDYKLAKEKNYAALYNYMQLFDQEFSKYPLSFIKKSKLSWVVLTHDLTIGMVPRKLSGLPDYNNKSIILNFLASNNYAGKNSETYQKHVIHHEYYHILHEQLDKADLLDTSTWNQLNFSFDLYGSAGILSQSPRASILNHPERGFVSIYAKSTPEEDKAEIFASLFVKEEYNKIKNWIKEDDFLLKKIKYLKNKLKSIDSSFTPEYWQKLQTQTYYDIKHLSEKIKKKYGITLYFESFPDTSLDVEYELASEKDYGNLYSFMKLFDQELSKYPLSFIKKAKLSKIALIHTLTYGMMFQRVTALSDFQKKLIIIDFIRGNEDEIYQKHLVHHELFHIIDEYFNKELSEKDPNWNLLNSKPDSYGAGGFRAQGSSRASILDHPFKGFVGTYAMSELREDKAEVFTVLYVQEEYDSVKNWIKEDEILLNKIKYLKKFLISIDENFTDQYWNNLHKNTHDHLK